MRILVLMISAAVLFSCSKGGQTIANNAKLTKSDSSRRRSVACSGSTTSCSPSNLGGRIFSASVMLGTLGSSAFGMTWLGATDAIIQDPSQGKGGSLEFSLSDQTTFSGKVAIPSEAEMPSPPTVSRVELNFDYLDTTFSLTGTSGGAADGEYTIRTVFVTDTTADDVTGTLTRADKLVKAPGQTEFKWCNTSTCSTDRSTVVTGLLTDSRLIDYEWPGQGNQNYAPYSVTLKDALTVSYAQISSTTNVWTLDFDMASAIEFAAAPSTFASVNDVVSNFKLLYAPNSNSGDGSDEGIKATLTIAAPTSR